MTSIQNVHELFASMMLTGNIKYCHELYYSKLLFSKQLSAHRFLPQYNYSLPINSHLNIKHRFEYKQAKGA
jgi:hypothetical protein